MLVSLWLVIIKEDLKNRSMVIKILHNNQDGPGGSSQHLHHNFFLGVNSFRHLLKGEFLLSWDTADYKFAKICGISSKTINANDNVANDNFEFAETVANAAFA